MKKTKEESTSSGTRKKKGSASGGRLTDMLESMQKRSSPVNAHKVATKYFDDFKKERQIPTEEPKESAATAVDTAKDSAVVNSKKRPRNKKSTEATQPGIDPLLSSSENKVYNVMSDGCLKKGTNIQRFGLKELKEKTGLSDKTVRVAIHSLEEKRNISVVEPSLGIYGRKFRVLSLKEVEKERAKRAIEIDPTTKKVTGSKYRGR